MIFLFDRNPLFYYNKKKAREEISMRTKRFCILTMILLLCMTMLPVPARAAGNIVINGVDIGYGDGDYFTKNGGPCTNSYWANNTCHNNNVCIDSTHPECNCMRYWPTGDPATCQVDLFGVQCMAYAHYCQWRVYGSIGLSADGTWTDLTGTVSRENCTADFLKSRLLGCAPATHVRTPYLHSISIISTSDDGVTLTEGNYDGKCRIDVKNLSWAEFASYIQHFRGISYTYSKADAMSAPSVPNAITGTWTTDLVLYAADLGVSAPDAVLRATLSFREDGTVTAHWQALDLTALRIYFRDLFVSAYYAMAYGSGITDLNQIEMFCLSTTGMSVSAYMDTIVTPEAVAGAFTPPDTQGLYSCPQGNSVVFTDLTFMGIPADSGTQASFAVENGLLFLNAAPWGRPEYTFVCSPG